MQSFDPHRTTWHITFGTYGTRLHGDERLTVDKKQNSYRTPFVEADSGREQREGERLNFPPILLSKAQQLLIQGVLPTICVRGGWPMRTCAAGPDHVHLLCDVVPEVHGEKVRRLVKRWLSQDLAEQWPLAPGRSWWAEEGSNRAIHDQEYLDNAYAYVCGQRCK